MLGSGLLVLVIPIVLISFITYKGTTDSMEKEIVRSYSDVLGQVQERVDSKLTLVNQAINPMLFDSDLMKLVYSDGAPDGLVMRRVQNKLRQLDHSISDIESVSLHVPEHSITLTSDRYINSYSSKRIANLPPDVPNGQWQSQRGDSYKVITFTRSLPVFETKPSAYLSIHFRHDAFKDILESVEFLSQGKLMIVNADQQEIYSYGSNQLDSIQVQHGLVEIMRKSDTDDQRFYLPDANLSTLYVQSEKTGWYSVLFIPNETLNPYKAKTIWMTLLIAVLAIVIGSILTFIQSKRLYKPINEWLQDEDYLEDSSRQGRDEWHWLRNKWVSLKDYNKKTAPVLRKSFLVGVLNGEYDGEDTEKLRSLFLEHGINERQKCIVLVVQPKRFEINKHYHKEDEFLICTGVNKIIEDLFTQYHLNGDLLIYQENQYTICTLYFPSEMDHERIKMLVLQVSQSVKMSAKTYFKVSPTIALGGLRETTCELRDSYLQAKKAMKYQILYRNEDILDIELINTTHHSKEYPIQLSEQLIASMTEGNKEGTEEVFLKFVENISEKKYDDSTVKQMFLMLYDAIIHSFGHFSQDIINELLNFPMFERIQAAESMNEMQTYFLAEWFPYCFERIEKEKEGKGVQLIETAKEYLSSTMEKEHSLSMVAEQVGLHPSYFSRLFRQETGQNFVSYVAALKVDKAKELLVETEHSIKEIAAQIGYTEQTFRRVFKNETGTTPSQYRKALR